MFFLFVQTSWANALLRLRMVFDENYPFAPPVCVFEPKISHPNVEANGIVCLPLIRTENWCPTTTIRCILGSIQHILNAPDIDCAYGKLVSETTRSESLVLDVNVQPTKHPDGTYNLMVWECVIKVNLQIIIETFRIIKNFIFK